ncbi:uncharacterized protein LOC105846011 [Hydra vulgaris]|uniref:Small ribosomal subunit protein mS40 n=1 Tax=Hydra vulgaris TaxID=6087 RepID=T2M213_HYDVU|nr:uncharacterized protein LOC105846011 [Hydra vulgaris]
MNVWMRLSVNIVKYSSYRLLSSTCIRPSTHDYSAVKLLFPSHFILDENGVNAVKQIRKNTGAVVRVVDNQENNSVENVSSSFLLLVGNSFQINKASEQIKNLFEGRLPKVEINKRSDFKLIWHGYKRNYKGQFAPLKPRKKCIRCGGKMLSGNPCPLCQLKINNDYDLHYTDVELLSHFVCPYTWQILSPYVTNICKMQYKRVEAAIVKARHYGLMPFTIPLPMNEPKKLKPAGVPTDVTIKVKMH